VGISASTNLQQRDLWQICEGLLSTTSFVLLHRLYTSCFKAQARVLEWRCRCFVAAPKRLPRAAAKRLLLLSRSTCAHDQIFHACDMLFAKVCIVTKKRLDRDRSYWLLA